MSTEGHPFHILLPCGVVFRGRIGPQCVAELEANGLTPRDVEVQIESALTQAASDHLDPDVAADEIDEDPDDAEPDAG